MFVAMVAFVVVERPVVLVVSAQQLGVVQRVAVEDLHPATHRILHGVVQQSMTVVIRKFQLVSQTQCILVRQVVFLTFVFEHW